MIQLQTCPICQRPLSLDAEEARRWFPFCSDRCRKVDFFRWVDGRYAIVESLSAEQLAVEAEKLVAPEDDAEA